MKRPIVQSIAFVTLVALTVVAIGACTAPNPSAPAAPSSKTTGAAPAGPAITLKYAFPYPQVDEMYAGPEFMFRELEKRTGGRVKVTPYFSESLGKATDSLNLLKNGVADVATFPPIFNNQLPISGIFTIPGLRTPNRAVSHEIAYQLWDKGLLKKEFATVGLKPLMWEGTDAMAFAFKKKITNLEDLRKLKMRSPPGVSANAVEALGSSVVTMPAGEVYMALDRGVVDGLVTMPGSFFSLKINEVAKYWLALPLGTGVNITAMSQEGWDKLPPDIRQIWEQINREAKYYFLDEMERRNPDRLDQFKKAGVEVYTISAEEAERWYKLTDPVTEKWIAEHEAAGYPAREAVNVAKATIKRYTDR